MTSLAVVLAAAMVPFTPLGGIMGFVEPPSLFFFVLLAMLACYLSSVEFMKQLFYRHFTAN